MTKRGKVVHLRVHAGANVGGSRFITREGDRASERLGGVYIQYRKREESEDPAWERRREDLESILRNKLNQKPS